MTPLEALHLLRLPRLHASRGARPSTLTGGPRTVSQLQQQRAAPSAQPTRGLNPGWPTHGPELKRPA